MPITSRLSPAVLAARDHLTVGREKLKKQHAGGSPGIQMCAALTNLLDTVLLELFQAALEEVGVDAGEFAERIALVPYGGYGRRDMAPFSDVDLMLLYSAGADRDVMPVVRRFTQHIYDVGLDLGFSPRTPAEACNGALKDMTIFTSLSEARLLAGNLAMFEKFQAQFRRLAKRRARPLIVAIDASRREERRQFGETNYLLEPNVKRSRGGLRDIQLIRWLGFVRCGEVEPENLVRAGILSKDDHARLRTAREFLLRLRNELHFHSGQASDVLTKAEQLRIAELYGYVPADAVLPVEQFMREYFEHTSDVRYTASNFVANSRPGSTLLTLVEPLFRFRLDEEFRVGPRDIRVTRRGLDKVCGDLGEVLRLMELANLVDKRIEHRTWAAIREAMMSRPTVELSPDATRRFFALLSQPARLGESLRRLHELRVLEKLVPGLSHARCLLQFNEYHKFTVDEHSIRAVECCTDFRRDLGPLGEAYRGIQRKDLLHLALLIHDLGKGFPEDHSEVGRRLAEETAHFLGLPERDTEVLQFLVHKHLVMSHEAQWRDINDNSVVLRFAVLVGSPDVLRMLYVLTCADIAAVGPGTLTDWKLRLITTLYHRTMSHIAGDAPERGAERMFGTQRAAVRAKVKSTEHAEWWDKHIAALPQSYLLTCPPERIVDELERLRRLPHHSAIAWGRYLAEQKAIEYTVGTYEEITSGIFHKLTGALTSKGLQILSAEINTLADGLVLDRFFVQDGDFAAEPPPERLDEVSQALVAALQDTSGKPPAFRKLWNTATKSSNSQLSQMPTQVRIDSTTSERFAIIDVFTHDRMGLLYAITRTLFELGLSVGVAKIGTHLDQVVDVFYVTDRAGHKIQDEPRLAEIRQRLLDALERTDPI